MPDDKEPIPQFAARIKAKYPQYKDVDDTLLAKKIVEKFPEYGAMVDFGPEPSKKKEAEDAYKAGLQKLGGFFGLIPSKSESVLKGEVKSIQGTDKVEQSKEEVDPEDPLKSMMAPIKSELGERYTNYLASSKPSGKESTNQNQTSRILKDKLDRENTRRNHMDGNAIVTMNAIQKQKEHEIFPDADKAAQLLNNYAANKGIQIGDLLDPNDETINNLPKNNETIKAAVKQIDDYRKVYDELQESGGRLQEAAINRKRKEDSNYNDKLFKLQEHAYTNDYNVTVPEAERGAITYDYITNPNVRAIAEKDPELKEQYDNLVNNFYQIYPEFGKTLVANKLSQAREDKGLNNPFLNVVGKATMDKIADEVLTPQEKQVYIDKIRPDVRGTIDTPGFVENFGTSALEGVEGVKQTFQELAPGASDADLLRESMDKAAKTVQVTPKSNLNKFGNLTGKFAGMVVPIGYGGRLLQGIGVAGKATTANALMTGLTFYGQEKAHARELMPKDEVGQDLFAAGTTAAYMFASNIFKDFKALDGLTKEIRPSIQNIVKEFNAGTISKEAARDAAATAFKTAANKALELTKGTITQNTKAALEMTAIQYGKNMAEKILAPESYNEGEHDRLLANTAISTWIGTTPMGLSAAYSNVKQKPVLKESLLYAAMHPEEMKDAIKLQTVADPSFVNSQDKLANIDFLAKTKDELVKQPGMTEKKLKSYLLQSLNRKMIEDTMPEEPTLKKKAQEKIKQAEINQEEILAGKDVDELPHEQKEELPDDKLEKELLKVAPEGYKEHHKALKSEGKEAGWLGYMSDKAAENPDKFIQEFGDDLFDRMIEKVGTKKLENSLNYLKDNIPEDANIPLLEQILEQRYDKKDKEVIEGDRRPKVSVIMPGEIKKPETITIKPDAKADLPDVTHEKMMATAKTGEPISFPAYRIETSEEKNLSGGVHFGDRGVTEEYKRRGESGFYGKDSNLFKGDVNRYNITFKNPLVIRSKEAFIKQLAESGDKEAQEVMPNYKQEDIALLETTHKTHQEFDDFVAKKAREKGYDGIIEPLEYVALTDKSYSKIKSENNAIQERIPEKATLDETSGDSGKMGEGIPESKEPPPTQEQVSKIEGEEEAIVGEGEKKTGIKNKVSEATRGVLELPKVEVPKLGSDHIILSEGKDLVDSGSIEPKDVVSRILNTDNHNMSRDEAKAMQYYMYQLGQHETEIRERLASTDDPTTKGSYVGLLGQLSDLQDAATKANIKAGKDWSDVGNIRQILVDQSFNPSREKATIKDNYGGEIPKDVQLKIDTALKERDEAISARTKLEEQLRQKMASAAFEKMKQRESKKKKTKEDIEALKKEESDLLKSIKSALKKDFGQANTGIPIPKETLEVLGKLAINYFKQGAKNIEQIITNIHAVLKEDFPSLDKKDIRDYLLQHEELQSTIDTQKLNKKAEGLEDKITPPILDKSGKTNEPKPVQESKPVVKPKFQKNTEWVKANQRVANAEYKIREIKRKSFESQKNMFQKGLMWAGRLTRLSVLSGYNVLYKLAAAATIGGAVKRIPEQVIGAIYSQIFKGIAQKAPIEGFWNAKSEAKFYKEFFNPKKFIKNTWQILKTGESDINKRFGGGGYEHVPFLYLPTDLHQVIKDPVKRATFEASINNGMAWAEKNGLDINDPLVINAIETAAYKRGNYEIFQEQNWLSRKFGEFKSKMEKSGNIGSVGKFLADFMIPVSTVPTNIVRRLTTTSPLGLIRGGKMVVDAYRKGIEKLTNEQGDAVMKQLKQGSLGTALWLIGWFGASHFGGLYSKYNPNKERDEGELSSDEMEVDGKMIPKPVQHALPFEIIQWAATARHIYDNYKDNKDKSTFESIYKAGMGSIGAVAEHIPVIETATHVAGSFENPYEAQKLEDDVKRRFEPQILRETGIIPKKEKRSNEPSHKAKPQKKKRA